MRPDAEHRRDTHERIRAAHANRFDIRRTVNQNRRRGE
jgi:hypothetical protein